MNNTTAGGATIRTNIELKPTSQADGKEEMASDDLFRDAACSGTIEAPCEKTRVPQHLQIPLMEKLGSDTGNPALNRVLTELWSCLEEQQNVASKDGAAGSPATNSSIMSYQQRARLAKEWNALGLIRMHMQSNADEAIKCFHQALHLYSESSTQNSSKPVRATPGTKAFDIAITLNDLAYCYMKIEQREKAFDTYQRAYDHFKECQTDESNIHMNATLRFLSLLSQESSSSRQGPTGSGRLEGSYI